MSSVEQIRAQFPILRQKVNGRPLVYLDSAATTHSPIPVFDRLRDFHQAEYSNIHRGVHALSQRASARYEEARQRVAAFLKAPSAGEVIFTSGATAAINLLAFSFGEAFVEAGDEILVSGMEHHANLIPWQQLCVRKGARLQVIPVTRRGQLDMEAFAELLNPRTALVAVTHVSNVLGSINPLRRIVSLAHAKEIPVLVDGAQAVAHMGVDVAALDVDFYVFSGHKLYADTGIGVLYAKRRFLDQMPPWQTGGGMVDRVTLKETEFSGAPQRFEAGTPHISGAIGLHAAIDFVEAISMETIAGHEQALFRLARQELERLEGIILYGPEEPAIGSLSFNLSGAHHLDVGMVLDKMGVAVRTGSLCAEPLMQRFGTTGMVRASFGVYNTQDDVHRLIEALHKAVRVLGE